MRQIPHDAIFDNSLDVLREGYEFIGNRCRRYDTDIFLGRLLGLKVVCLHGPDGARLFYDPEHFIRKGTIPRRVQTTLLGVNGVQTLDGDHHGHRKRHFLSLMTPGSSQFLLDELAAGWPAAARLWERRPQVQLHAAAQDVLCRAACTWAGVPLREDQVRRRARDFGWMVDGFGGFGARHARGRRARNRAESWLRGLIEQIRRGEVDVPADSPAAAWAHYREPDGELLSPQIAAVELVNVVKPVVAISYYISFGAKALAEHPPYRQLLQTDPDYPHYFAQEVRRFFPFAPFLSARAREAFTWRGYEIPKVALVVLDVYGTNRDPRVWPDADTFWPDRFRDREPTPYDLVAQGGGEYGTGHRCPGEPITVSVLQQAMRFLAGLRYDVPPQDLGYSLTRMPTRPRSGVLLENVRLAEAEAPAVVAGCPFHH